MANTCKRCGYSLADHEPIPGFGILGPFGQWCELWPPAALAVLLERLARLMRARS